jgi:hypothetical protein
MMILRQLGTRLAARSSGRVGALAVNERTASAMLSMTSLRRVTARTAIATRVPPSAFLHTHAPPRADANDEAGEDLVRTF